MKLIKDDVACRLYMLCLARTRYVGSDVVDGLAVGQCLLGHHEAAEELGLFEPDGQPSRGKIRRALTAIKAASLITSKPTNRGTIVTICGYARIPCPTEAERPAESPAVATSDHTTNKIQISDLAATNRSNDQPSSAGGAPLGVLDLDLDLGDQDQDFRLDVEAIEAAEARARYFENVGVPIEDSLTLAWNCPDIDHAQKIAASLKSGEVTLTTALEVARRSA
jgi:hypothetical protein